MKCTRKQSTMEPALISLSSHVIVKKFSSNDLPGYLKKGKVIGFKPRINNTNPHSKENEKILNGHESLLRRAQMQYARYNFASTNRPS